MIFFLKSVFLLNDINDAPFIIEMSPIINSISYYEAPIDLPLVTTFLQLFL